MFSALIAALAFLSQPAGAGERTVPLLNAEDLAPLQDGKWVIASSMAGGMQAAGGLFAIDVADGTTRKLYPADDSANAVAKVAGCPTQVAAADFEPHGIALQTDAHGMTRLYVVNHGGRESVEIFEVEQRPAPALRWIGCAIAPAGTYGNAVAVTADGTIFMTNMGKPVDGSARAFPRAGEVASWSAADGWRRVSGSTILMPNGLLASADGRELFVAAWSSGEVIALALGEGPNPGVAKRRVLKAPFLPDNLRWSRNGNILAAGHRASVAAVSACVMAKGRCPDHIPSAIAEIDPESLTTRCAQNVNLSIATVAVNVGAETWVGPTRGDSVLRLPDGTLAAPNCES